MLYAAGYLALGLLMLELALAGAQQRPDRIAYMRDNRLATSAAAVTVVIAWPAVAAWIVTRNR